MQLCGAIRSWLLTHSESASVLTAEHGKRIIHGAMDEATVELLTQLLAALTQSSYEYKLRVKVLDRIALEHPEALPDYDKFLEEGRKNRGVQRSHDGIVEVLDKLRQALLRE
jgi:hypothetical protein